MKKKLLNVDIKLLRLPLQPSSDSPFEDIDWQWSPAQPTQILSPQKAAEDLGLNEWDKTTLVKKRYRTLQLRYPPEQFPQKHAKYRPAFELLSNATTHLNWYWQSALIPSAPSVKTFDAQDVFKKLRKN